jgi:hypothetical protein
MDPPCKSRPCFLSWESPPPTKPPRYTFPITTSASETTLNSVTSNTQSQTNLVRYALIGGVVFFIYYRVKSNVFVCIFHQVLEVLNENYVELDYRLREKEVPLPPGSNPLAHLDYYTEAPVEVTEPAKLVYMGTTGRIQPEMQYHPMIHITGVVLEGRVELYMHPEDLEQFTPGDTVYIFLDRVHMRLRYTPHSRPDAITVGRYVSDLLLPTTTLAVIAACCPSTSYVFTIE